MTVFPGTVSGIALDWIIFPVIGVAGIVLVSLLLLMMRGRDESAIESDQAFIIPEDQHGTLQVASLVGNVTRTETQLIVPNPEWADDEGNEYHAELDIEKKVPLPYLDSLTRKLNHMWLVLDRGHLEVVSFTSLLHGFPRRWDPPVVDRSKAGRFLVGRYSSSSIGSILGSKMGIALIAGLLQVGGLLWFFLIFLSGHIH